MEIVIAVVAKVAEYTVGPIVRPIARHIVRPIARPFINLWEYKSNLDNLKKEVEKLEEKRESVQRLTNVGVEPLPDVRAWQDDVTNIIREVSRLTSENNPEQQNMECCKGCTYSNLKECYQHRNNVARKLKDVAQLLQEAMKSTNLWEYKSNLENLKKEVEKLEARRESVQRLIKDGEKPLEHVKLWQENVNKIIAEVSRLINPQQQNMQCCNGLTCSDLDICYQRRNNVARMLDGVALLLQEARDFREVANISEETVYKSNLEKLKKDVETLKHKRESVQRLIKVGEEPLPDVKVWRDRVTKIIDEVPGLTIEHNPEHQKEVAQMLKEIAQLLQEAAQFREVSCPSTPAQTCLQPSIQQEFSESRMSILKGIIAELTKADVNIVGIYGMGGVGKTTLAKEAGSQAEQDKLFDKVVLVEVSQSPDISTIQGVIADHLGLQFKGETVPGRASKLYDYLKKEEKKNILIILDNLWKKIKLEDVGIPFGNDCKGLKLLLTARSRDVLRNEMDSQKNFPVEALCEKDAWILFKNIAGTHVDHPRLNSVATEVANKCAGLPLAINAVAKALKGTEAIEEWTEALRRLNNPSPEGFEREIYNSIKWSYDCLTEELREIFLLCSRMGRTYDASVQDLFKYGLGLGYFDEFDTVEGALCNVYASVKQLKDVSLLLDPPDEFSCPTVCEGFAIHDVICDIARSIASKDRHVFTMLDDHVPRSLTNENTLKNCTSITLYNICEPSKNLELVCPNLEFLYVKLKDSYLTIPDNFFIGMSSLQVLHLIEIDLKPLPSSLSCLVNLRALCLDHCELGDVAAIGDMNKLDVLSFRGSDIQMLPKELCQLTKLRLLDLTDCFQLSVIPSKVMSCLTGIEALHMIYTSIKWEDTRPSIDELKHLHRLTTLEIHIPESKMFRGLISSEPKRYNICIGGLTYDWEVREPYSNISRRFLRLELDTKEDWIISQLPGVEELELEGDVVGAMNLLDDLDRNGFPRLMHLDVASNYHCVCIVNSLSGAVLPSLESLVVQRMGSLKKICGNPLGAESFLNLKTINVKYCDKLSNIFCFFSIVRDLPNLIDLEVSDCKNMEEIFVIEEQDDGNSTDVVHDIKFSQLSRLRLTNLPKLKSFCCKAKAASPLQLASDTSASQIFSAKELNNHLSLFNEKVAIPNLGDLKVYGIHQIKQIWHCLLPTSSSCVQNITELVVCRCDNLKELFSFSMAISEKAREKEMRDTIVFPKLNNLVLRDLTKLTRLCSGCNIEIPSLKKFEITNCPQLKEFIFDETVAIPNLGDLKVNDIHQIEQIWHYLLPTSSSCVQNITKLEVRRCDNLKELFLFSMAISEKAGEKERRDTIVFPKLNGLILGGLTKLTRLCSGCNIEFPSLKKFEITNCPQLKEFIFDETVVIPNLGDLTVYEIHQIEQIWHYLLPTSSSCVQNITKFEVWRCDNLKELFSFSMAISEKVGEKERKDTIVFPKLNSLILVGLTKLTRLSSGYNIEFPSLEIFVVYSCPQLKEFIFDETVKAPNLEELRISDVDNLKMVWHNKFTEDSFSTLKTLVITKCHKLLAVFPSNMCGRLLSLESLNVDDCRSLVQICDIQGINSEEYELVPFMNLKELKVLGCPSLKYIFAKEGVVAKEVPVRFVFPKLTSLKLNRSLYPGKHTVEGPILKKLELCDSGIHHTDEEGQMQQPLLYLVQQVFPCLEELKLPGKEFMMMGLARVPECLLHKLKILNVYNPESIVFPLGIIQMFQNLEKLSLTGVHQTQAGSYKEIFLYGEDQTQAAPLAKMKTLFLQYLGDLKYMWEQDSKWDLIFQNFEVLTVDTCNSLVNLMLPPSFFQNLIILNVRNCNSLETIVTSSVVKSLMKLETMCISHCPKITEVIQNDGEAIEKIIFGNLKTLKLIEADNLTSFCSCNFTLEFPSLEKLEVCSCRNMKTFFQGDLTMPKLREVRINRESFRLRPDTNLNTIIQQFHAERYSTKIDQGCSSSQHME